MAHAETPEINPYAPPRAEVTPQAPPDRTRHAGYGEFWRRLLASLIDGAVTLLVWMSAVMAYYFVLGVIAGISFRANLPVSDSTSSAVSALLFFAIPLIYYPAFESSAHQATPGKMAMGLQVTDRNGRRISFLRAAVRLVAKALSAAILLLGFLMAAFTPKKQALHDLIVGTLVVRLD
jgi:uncharacterized RDD family membrane protein YckC